MRPPRAIIWSPLVVFPLAFAAASALNAVVAAHVFGLWDPKWGSPAGAVRFHLQLLPLFTALQTAGHIIGLVVMLRWIDRESNRSAVWIGISAAVITEVASEALIRGTDLNPVLESLLEPLGFFWGIGFGGLVSTVLVTALAYRRRHRASA